MTHIKCELIFEVEQMKETWAKEMLVFLDKAYHLTMQAKRYRLKSLVLDTVKVLEHQYCNILTQAQKNHPEKINPKTKRVKRTKTQNLIKRLLNYKDDLLRFLTALNVPFTNNQAERDLRMCKVAQKVSGALGH